MQLSIFSAGTFVLDFLSKDDTLHFGLVRFLGSVATIGTVGPNTDNACPYRVANPRFSVVGRNPWA